MSIYFTAGALRNLTKHQPVCVVWCLTTVEGLAGAGTPLKSPQTFQPSLEGFVQDRDEEQQIFELPILISTEHLNLLNYFCSLLHLFFSLLIFSWLITGFLDLSEELFPIFNDKLLSPVSATWCTLCCGTAVHSHLSRINFFDHYVFAHDNLFDTVSLIFSQPSWTLFLLLSRTGLQ